KEIVADAAAVAADDPYPDLRHVRLPQLERERKLCADHAKMDSPACQKRYANAALTRAQSSSASSWPGTIGITIWLQPALRSASMRWVSSCSVAVKVVRRISSALINGRSSGLTKTKW